MAEADIPPELQYLVDWTRALFGRSGADMSGIAPLNPLVVAAWSFMSGNRVTSLELEGMLAIDAALRYREPAENG